MSTAPTLKTAADALLQIIVKGDLERCHPAHLEAIQSGSVSWQDGTPIPH